MANSFQIPETGAPYQLVVIVFAYIYLMCAIVRRMWQQKKGTISSSLRPLLKSILTVSLIYIVHAAVIGLSVHIINTHSTPAEIAANDDRLMAIDKQIFGYYPPLWFQDDRNPSKPIWDALTGVLAVAYEALPLIVGLLYLLLLIKAPRRFLQAIIVFAACFLIGLPGWYHIPAVSPRPRYVDNLLHVPVPDEVQQELIHYQPNPKLQAIFAKPRVWEQQQSRLNYYWVTTFPSTHIAWGMIPVYFGIVTVPWLAIVLIPYLILNVISTIFLLQHYAIDLPAGLALWLMAMVVSEIGMQHWPTPHFITYFHNLAQQDINQLRAWWKKRQ